MVGKYFSSFSYVLAIFEVENNIIQPILDTWWAQMAELCLLVLGLSPFCRNLVPLVLQLCREIETFFTGGDRL